MVDDSKAYCPDCGAPMDEEQKRSGSSEYDSLMKTQNLNMTSQLKILEQFNLSSVFTPPSADEAGAVKKEPVPVREPVPVKEPSPIRETKTVQLQAIPEIDVNAGQPAPVIPSSKSESSFSATDNSVINTEPNSKKTLYIVGGVALLITALGLAAAVTFGILYWYNAK